VAVIEQKITDRYAAYRGDCIEVMADMPEASIDLSVYSPPFGGLYCYSSDIRDLSNCDNYEQFFEHYSFVIRDLHRITKPGRLSGVHCTDIHKWSGGDEHLVDFSGDIIRAHRREGWDYVARYAIWKEPLGVRNRTMAKGLAHRTIVEDSSRCSAAHADYLLMFRKRGEVAVPIAHPVGLLEYAGEDQPPQELQKYRGYSGAQTENRYSHWIWRRYASAFWSDIRLGRVLPFEKGKDEDDEKHVHPLQLDVVDRCLHLWSNPGDVVFTPFMGVGTEVYAAVCQGRKGVGVELKESYYKQALKNLAACVLPSDRSPTSQQTSMFA
jgi:DNA modification methylase